MINIDTEKITPKLLQRAMKEKKTDESQLIERATQMARLHRMFCHPSVVEYTTSLVYSCRAATAIMGRDPIDSILSDVCWGVFIGLTIAEIMKTDETLESVKRPETKDAYQLRFEMRHNAQRLIDLGLTKKEIIEGFIQDMDNV